MSKWTDETIENEIRLFMEQEKINHMPTSQELRPKHSGLGRAISLTGGFDVWAHKLNLPRKEKDLKWTDSFIESEIKKCIDVLMIDRMPTANELKGLGRNDLHCAISKKRKYSWWAENLNLELKSCDTRTGNHFENKVADAIQSKGYEVDKMTHKHPYDLLINKSVKVEVKSGRKHEFFGSSAYTIALNRENPTSDLTVVICFSEGNTTDKILVIPSYLIPMKTLNIGINSKYDDFKDRWDYLYNFISWYKGLSKQRNKEIKENKHVKFT